jgi:two-component sensor histidine kinase
MEKFLAILPEKPQPVWVRYGATCVIIFLNTFLQVAVFNYTGFTGFFLLLPGIFACGILFDRGSAIVATVAGVILTTYLTPLSVNSINVIPLGLFVLTGAATAVVSEGLRKVLEKLAAANEAKDVLLRELEHRTKNNLAIMSSLLHFQARASLSRETQDALKAAAARVRLMADLHNFLKPSESRRLIAMDRYLRELFDKMEEFQGRASVSLSLNAEPIDLPESAALSVAIVVNELVTNSLKHAFPDGIGTVSVALRKDGGDLLLEVSDDGVGSSADAEQGMGSRLVQAMARQLNGALTREAGSGCRTVLRMPLP